MNTPLPLSVSRALAERRASGMLRCLVTQSKEGIDLCSNDYLGLARALSDRAIAATRHGGATGSRLVSGNTTAHEELEEFLAAFHQAGAALMFGSGYEANVGLLSCLGGRADTLVYDELAHASMRDGIRLNPARSFSFRHNDIHDLALKLRNARGEVFVAVESVYSMDGHVAPLRDIIGTCRSVGAHLIVDEAHATGLYGPYGGGLVQELGLHDEVFARVHTFGKALGYRGAAVVGPPELRDYLVNFARPFIYSTAPDRGAIEMIRLAYALQRDMHEEREKLFGLISSFRALRSRFKDLTFLDSSSPIQGVIIPGNEMVTAAEHRLAAEGFFARAIRSPTVPAGQERIRICLHSFNDISELEHALLCIASASLQGARAHGY